MRSWLAWYNANGEDALMVKDSAVYLGGPTTVTSGSYLLNNGFMPLLSANKCLGILLTYSITAHHGHT